MADATLPVKTSSLQAGVGSVKAVRCTADAVW